MLLRLYWDAPTNPNTHKISSCLNKNVITYDKELQFVQTNNLINMAIPIAIEE